MVRTKNMHTDLKISSCWEHIFIKSPKLEISYINVDNIKLDNDKRHKIWHSDRSPLEEQFCIFKILKMSAIFKMAAKTWYKKGR